jgi:hypothetical protein
MPAWWTGWIVQAKALILNHLRFSVSIDRYSEFVALHLFRIPLLFLWFSLDATVLMVFVATDQTVFTIPYPNFDMLHLHLQAHLICRSRLISENAPSVAASSNTRFYEL